MTTIKFLKNSEITKPKAVILDWDNTIVNSRHVMHLNIHRACDDLDVDPDNILLNKYFESVQDPCLKNAMIRVIGEEKGRQLFKRYVHHFNKSHLQEIYLNPGALMLLEMMHQKHIPMVILSNKEEDCLVKEVEALKVKKYFQKVTGFIVGNPYKPSGAAARLALDGVCEDLDKSVWFIGDSDVDVMCANEEGCSPILFGPINVSLKEHMLCYHVNNFRDLADIFTHTFEKID